MDTSEFKKLKLSLQQAKQGTSKKVDGIDEEEVFTLESIEVFRKHLT